MIWIPGQFCTTQDKWHHCQFLLKEYLSRIYSLMFHTEKKNQIFTTTTLTIFNIFFFQPWHVKVKQLNNFWIHLLTLYLMFCVRNSTSNYTPTDTSAHSCHRHFIISPLPAVCATLTNISKLFGNGCSFSFIMMEIFSKHSSAFAENEFKISLSIVTCLSIVV